jgi:hypothetical protein
MGIAGGSPSIRYALGKHGQAAAFMFGYPLMAGEPRALL